MLTKIIYKNFRSNFKNYVAFFIGNMMGVTEFFVFWGLYSIVKNMSANSVMLEDTLEEIIISVSVITIFSTALMVYSMLNYIKKRIADYGLFYILGMKKQKLYVFVFSEYLAGWMVSLLIGLGIGRGILYLIQQIWHKLFPTYISLCSVGTEIYFNTCKISFFIMLAVVFVPCEYCDYADHETTYDKKIVAGEEISSLTGCYSTPKCENLIVFSDEYFKKAQNEWKDIEALTGFKLERYKAMYGDDGEPYIIEGPTKLVFIQTDKKYIDQIDKELESKEERHKYIGNYDSTVKFHYLSKTAITDMKTERAVKSMICVYIIITLSILNWIMLYAMNEMEKKEKAEREKFLVSMGMDRKERKKMNKREWYIYWIVPTIILIISTILFMRDTMTARMYPDDIRKICELQEAVVIAVWIVINGIYFWIMNRKARRG